ncbi:MAG: hypothetical protein COU46_00960 [Candidatus Niyogibacteria bacterium CG10_big_fil_rev_8_21_14_0_10_42_19]|uniref:DUF444 domain-containing protein n=1 Tax=Candidatus Niyogibacteria bacterium CG10_big_fil_rev_8_21_14_0_10_42_19 TaxID=1974725 RepID=A0A2H0TG72_9BACT|nr:MAG: hypothetical protein COU46_00960 [Candidatus Niyogibacteria bacterium CG10_big_fil_rev_8_21_14_0_10_42_19]
MDMKYLTFLDRVGNKLALKSAVFKKFSYWQKQILAGLSVSLESMQDLLNRNKERKNDGFAPKIKFRKILTANNKVISVPYVDEEKLVHSQFEPKNIELKALASDSSDETDIDETIGHGDGEVGDVIGQVPISDGGGEGDGDGDGQEGQGPDSGEGEADHSLEEEVYDFGKNLTERFQLPNLKDKVKKVPTDEYTYDLTDRHKGSGQVLDKKETLKCMVKTNLILGRVDKDHLDTGKMVVSPGDKTFRVLSRERVWKAQAVACFMRDYSGSMSGEPTRALVSQHLMIYSWLLVQYEKRVLARFFVHDYVAKEVNAREYFSLDSFGGTLIASGYKKINETIESEGLESNYNIYVFQGTDGDDFDSQGEQALPELNKILGYASRMGVTLFKHPYYSAQNQKTTFEQYIEKGGILERQDVFRMHVMPSYSNVSDEMNIEALKNLIA